MYTIRPSPTHPCAAAHIGQCSHEVYTLAAALASGGHVRRRPPRESRTRDAEFDHPEPTRLRSSERTSPSAATKHRSEWIVPGPPEPLRPVRHSGAGTAFPNSLPRLAPPISVLDKGSNYLMYQAASIARRGIENDSLISRCPGHRRGWASPAFRTGACGALSSPRRYDERREPLSLFNQDMCCLFTGNGFDGCESEGMEGYDPIKRCSLQKRRPGTRARWISSMRPAVRY